MHSLNSSELCCDDLRTALEQAVTRAQWVTGCEQAGIYLTAGCPWQQPAHLVAHFGLTEAQAGEAALLPVGTGLAGQVICTDNVLVLTRDCPLPPDTVPTAFEAGFASFAAAPLDCGERDRGVLWVRSGEVVHDPDQLQARLALLAECTGVTVRNRLLYENVLLERDRYQRLAATVGECFWSLYLEPEAKVVLMSEGARELTGYDPEDFLADPDLMTEVIHPDDRWLAERVWSQVLEGSVSEINHRVRMQRRDGKVCWGHTRGRVIRDEQGLRVDAITTDVSDQVRLEERVRRADRLSAVGMLAGGIAHEYNNLHFAILGTLDLILMRDDLDAALRQHIDRVREAAERASEITTNLVAFARGGTGARAVVNLSELAESTLNVVRKEFTTSGIEVVTEFWPETLPVMANRAELAQVLVNLIVNARQAMTSGDVKRLQLSTGLRDGYAYVRLTDSGHGISPDNMARLFDPFFTTKGAAGSWMEDRAQGDAYLPGRGLGLSVAQTIVHEHNGAIEVESPPDEGATFTVLLPLYQPEAGVLTGPQGAMLSRKGKILVADDEPSVRAVCRELLQHLSFDVREATGGEEAWELLQKDTFALVLVDLQMPDMDGLELIRRINEMPRKQRPAKLVITGRTDHLAAETCAELGIASTVQKPASLVELTEKVQLALSRGSL